MRPFAKLAPLCTLLCTLLISVLAGTAFAADGPPGLGQTMPALSLKTPAYGQDAKELGVAGKKTFRLQDLKAKVIVLEVIGVYCDVCTKQVGAFNTLYARLGRLMQAGEVRMFALAAGGNDLEVESLRKTGIYKYPVVADEQYKNHKLLREPKTPYTMVVTSTGKVLYAHLGIDDDIEGLLALIKGALK
jgi:peroxiredoxin